VKFLSTEGRIYSMDIRPSRWPRRTYETSKSEIQWYVGNLVEAVYPTELILEEFYIPYDRLYIDFFLPRKRLAVEVQGEQHYAFSAHFHGTMENFKRAQERDNRKSLWCTMNDIRLIKIRGCDEEEEIRNKLLSDN
jgi:hypothetical protein